MDLSAQFLRDSLNRVDIDGWDSDAGRQLLDHVRRAVVVPAVRRSGLRGPVADQAEASGWEAAWDALRRPSARTAENPGGMVWVAVRRAVATESGRPTLRAAPEGRPRCLSLDELMDSGWHPTGVGPAEGPGPAVGAVLDALVDAGWERGEAADAIAILADHAAPDPSGPATTRWRWVSLRLGVPEWRARRLAGVLLGGPGWPGVLELVVTCGPDVLADPAVRGALTSTTSRWSAGPGAWLTEWNTTSTRRGIA